MDNAFIGEVRAMPYGFVPNGWMPCRGELLSCSQYPALYSLIGPTYGGDGQVMFALPDIPPLAGREGTLQYCIAIQGLYPQRA